MSTMCNTCKYIDMHAPWCPEPIRKMVTDSADFLGATGNAATPEPPPKHNNYPASADAVAADVLGRGMPLGIAEDIMARKEMGLKKYGTALQPCNGRDNLNDLYQEVVDGVKYAKTELLERFIKGADYSPELMDVYETLLDLLERVYTLKGGDKRNGAEGP